MRVGGPALLLQNGLHDHSGGYRTSGGFYFRFFLICGFPVYQVGFSLSSSPIQRGSPTGPTPESRDPERRGGARDGGGASGQRLTRPRWRGWVRGPPPPRQVVSQPGCLLRGALWPRCCWDLASSPVAVLPERGVARGSGGLGTDLPGPCSPL